MSCLTDAPTVAATRHTPKVVALTPSITSPYWKALANAMGREENLLRWPDRGADYRKLGCVP